MRGAAAEAGAVLVHCWRSGRRRCRRRRPWQKNFILSFIGVSFITKRTDSGRQPPPKAPGPLLTIRLVALDRRGPATNRSNHCPVQNMDQLWWHPMLPDHGVRAEEADMVFDIQMVIVIDQMRRLMSPRASRAC
ncbi:uncharacterized protein LOC125516367 isoform X4 [Triticum urartu]|uniref:uncharacterized protein LOC125516367 isoform X4 n=1 Tax=Triticum urartu TaxID=4572 RepID=UPI002043228B|nr:uncharacterized protein LOC125516367 isoform X4 [Triticum urartu]